MDIPNKLKPFSFHGVIFNKKCGEWYQGNCIFCGKNNHFFVHYEKCHWNCKRCGITGKDKPEIYGLYSFFSAITERAKETTTDEAIKTFCKVKQLPISIVRKWQVYYDDYLDRFILPVYNDRQQICNIRVFRSGKWLNTAGCKSTILGVNRLLNIDKNFDPVYIVEGESDLFALDWLLKRINKVGLVVSIPGANVFKKEWSILFKSRDVIICYDNDKAGKLGTERIKNYLENFSKSIKFINWGENFKNGYDVKDFIYENCIKKAKPLEGYKKLQKLIKLFKLESDDIANKPLEKKPTLDELFISLEKDKIDVTPTLKQAIKIALATIISSQLPGSDPTWLQFVGPPACGKTLVVDLFKKSKLVHYESNLKAQSLISGFKTQSGKEASLIPKLNKKCLILKDFTELLRLPNNTRDEIMGVLGGAYDGTASRSYGNDQYKEFKSVFTILACVTFEIYKFNSSSNLGERFLRFNFKVEQDKDLQQKRAMEKALSDFSYSEDCLNKFAAFIDSPIEIDNKKLIKMIPSWYTNKLIALSRLVATLRTSIIRHQFGSLSGEIIYHPEPETGNRLSVQLQRLSLALGLVEDVNQLNNDIYNLIKKVGLSTIPQFTLKIINFFIENKNKAITIRFIGKETKISVSTVRRYVEDFVLLKIIDKIVIKENSKDNFYYKLSNNIFDLWLKADLDKLWIKNKSFNRKGVEYV